MDTCEFTYISRVSGERVTAKGVEQSWDTLCVKCDRDGPALPDATHFFTISAKGPSLFAVNALATDVFYHDEGQWHRYITAHDIKFGIIPDTGIGCPDRESDIA